MASNTPGDMTVSFYRGNPAAVSGYSGYKRPADPGAPTSRDAFPALPVVDEVYPKAMASVTSSFQKEKAKQESRILSTPGYKLPGYAGHVGGHQSVAGYTYGALCLGDAGKMDYAAFGPDAPGLNTGPQIIKNVNLRPGATLPDGAPKTKAGYTGHLPGRHFSSNFGENFNATAVKFLEKNGAAGHVKHVGEFPTEADRPMRLKVAVAGYKGFRPRTTPQAL